MIYADTDFFLALLKPNKSNFPKARFNWFCDSPIVRKAF